MSSSPPLLTCQGIRKSFGARPLFAGLSFSLHEGERVGVVGPNGSGKSTFLSILAGRETPDAGERVLRRLTRLGYVPQDPELARGKTVRETLLEALADESETEEFEKDQRVAEAISRGGFAEPDQRVETLSGGWRKRLAIVAQWMRRPDVLLLDEPTNHLDLDAVLWLESLLGAARGAFVVVSHDRYFLERVATRMVEINRRYDQGVFEARGRYSDFLIEREAALASLAAQQDALANRVRREIEWLRRGPQGRQTKQQARIKEAGQLIDQLADVRERSRERTADIRFSATERRTRKLLETRGLAKGFGSRAIVKDLDLRISPATRLGLVGANGSGKTTLLRLIEGTLAPDAGEISRADGLRVVHFTQNRSTLDPDLPLKKALAENGDTVVYQDRSLHVASWAKRFLFASEQLELPIGRLSGGEQARVLIAKLMLQPADLLILDEPTNDLDIPTLEVLEDTLLEFTGGLVLVTHDRYLLDRVSSELLALDGAGGATLYADLDQWLAARPTKTPAPASPRPVAPRKAAAPRLTYREQLEWDGMEGQILAAEATVSACEAGIADPAISSDATELHHRCLALEEAQLAVRRLYDRWAELEAKLASGAALQPGPCEAFGIPPG